MFKKNKIKKIKAYNAFTVIEMLAVVAIIGILSGTTIIALSSYQSTIDLNGVARDLITDLRYAQQLAVSEQTRYGIQLFESDNKYQIIKYGESEEVLKEKNLPSGISFQSITGLSEDKVKFNPYGSVEEEGDIILTNGKGDTKTIQIKPSGFVKIQ